MRRTRRESIPGGSPAPSMAPTVRRTDIRRNRNSSAPLHSLRSKCSGNHSHIYWRPLNTKVDARREVEMDVGCAGPSAPWMARASLHGRIHGVSGTTHVRLRRDATSRASALLQRFFSKSRISPSNTSCGGGGAGAASWASSFFFIAFIPLISRKIANATMAKSRIDWTNLP